MKRRQQPEQHSTDHRDEQREREHASVDADFFDTRQSGELRMREDANRRHGERHSDRRAE
jgi:hypothetical protein